MKGCTFVSAVILADGIDLPLVLFYGVLILVPLMAFQVAVEAGILAPILRIPFKTLARGVFLANCCSFIAGIPTKALNAWLYSYLLPVDLINYFKRYPFAIAGGTGVYFVVTVLVEWGCMRWWLKKSNLPNLRLWRGVLIANTATYLVLGPLHYFGTRPFQNVRDYTADTQWAEKPQSQVIYIDSKSGHLKSILSDGSKAHTVAPVSTTNYLVSSDLRAIWIQDPAGTSHLYRDGSVEKVSLSLRDKFKGIAAFGPHDDTTSQHSDSFEQWRAWAEPGLGNCVYVYQTNEYRKDYVRVAVNPGLLHFPNFSFYFSNPAFISKGRECLFESAGGIYLLDIANRRVGKLADGTNFILLTDKYARPQ
jgi:hypothetical protein